MKWNVPIGMSRRWKFPLINQNSRSVQAIADSHKGQIIIIEEHMKSHEESSHSWMNTVSTR